MKDYKNILIIRMSSLGDIIHALPTVAALRKNYPKANIVWAVHERFSDIIPGKPYVDELLYIDREKLKNPLYWITLYKKMKAYNFDIALDLQCFTKSALVSWLSGAKEKFGYWEVREFSKFINTPLIGPHQYGHVIERYLDTVRVLGGQVDAIEFPLSNFEEEEHRIIEYLDQAGIKRPYIVVAPGTRWKAKDWPVEKYGELCQRIANEGVSIILTGSKDDIQKSLSIKAMVPHTNVVDVTGKTTIKELMAILKASSLFIGGDTGPLHIANALKIPLIGLYGPTSPERLAPYGYDEIEIILSPTSEATQHKYMVHDFECMKQITVERVWKAYKKLFYKGK